MSRRRPAGGAGPLITRLPAILTIAENIGERVDGYDWADTYQAIALPTVETDQEWLLHSLQLYLRRLGDDPAAWVLASIYTVDAGLPDELVASSALVSYNALPEDVPTGVTAFSFPGTPLPEGEYILVARISSGLPIRFEVITGQPSANAYASSPDGAAWTPAAATNRAWFRLRGSEP